MQRFKNILVGVGLSQRDPLISPEVTPPSREAVERALWLAKLNSAHLTFFCALYASEKTQQLMEESGCYRLLAHSVEAMLSRLHITPAYRADGYPMYRSFDLSSHPKT